MPASKKTKKKTDQLKLVKQSTDDVTVRDCLVWPQDDKVGGKLSPSRDYVVYVSLRQQKQPESESSFRLRGEMCSAQSPFDDGSVGDALRGWPRDRLQHCEQRTKLNDDVSTDQQKVAAAAKTKMIQASKSTKSKTKTTANKEKDEDVHVPDLISQRYLYECMQQKEAELERERRKKEAREKAAAEGRKAAKDRTDIKANKAAQLRAIALADRVEASPCDLWKMDKFTRSAQAHVSTFRNGRGTGGRSARGGSVDGIGTGRETGRRSGHSARNTGRSDASRDDNMYDGLIGAPCTCPDKVPYYDGCDVYEYEDCAGDPTESDNFADRGDIYSCVETSY